MTGTRADSAEAQREHTLEILSGAYDQLNVPDKPDPDDQKGPGSEIDCTFGGPATGHRLDGDSILVKGCPTVASPSRPSRHASTRTGTASVPVLGIQTPLPWPLGPRGREATDPTEYPVTDWTEEGVRQVNRYPMSAPGDLVWDQFIRLETDRFTDPERRGDRLEGNEAHGWVVQKDTGAWANTPGVIEGGEVIPYVEERTRWGRWRSVYDDDDYPGTDPVPLDSLPGGGG